jgi:small subunit ribosomal protein S15
MLTKERKSEIISEFEKQGKKSGTTEVQIVLLDERIKQISKHLQSFSKDKHSRFGLIKIISHKRKLIKYLQRKDKASYTKLMESYLAK